MNELKERIKNAITTMKKWPNVVKVNNEYYGIYFHGKEIFVIHNSCDTFVEELPKDVVEKIVVELEANRFEVNKSFQG